MDTFITDDFLLNSSMARTLYHEYAKQQPIIDYHSHLSPQEIAENRKFNNLAEIWLAGDHYKWRAMRTNGVAEKYCTGDADDYEKFLAFAKTVPKTLRNPIYHWTHLELKRYFGIDQLLDESSARSIWDEANEKLNSDEYRVQGLLKMSQVEVVCTTDDPVDDLAYHQQIRGNDGLSVLPTFRPDKALQVQDRDGWKAYLQKLEGVSNISCGDLAGLLAGLKSRHDYFHELGGRLSDHGLNFCPSGSGDFQVAESVYRRLQSGDPVSEEEIEEYQFYLMCEFGRWDAEKQWTKQLHLGAMRNNNQRLFRSLGPDTGFDSIGDYPQGERLSRYLDALDSTDQLPKTILYNLNPSDNYLIGAMIGNFQDGSIPGKVQFGSGWWFLDQKEGMEWQLNALSSLGLLSRFVGMLTDSRSFLSFPRHEYFRRILCNLIGQDVENGALPKDPQLLGELVQDVCYRNAESFFGFQ